MCPKDAMNDGVSNFILYFDIVDHCSVDLEHNIGAISVINTVANQADVKEVSLRCDEKLVLNVNKVLRHLNSCIPRTYNMTTCQDRKNQWDWVDMRNVAARGKYSMKRTFQICILD